MEYKGYTISIKTKITENGHEVFGFVATREGRDTLENREERYFPNEMEALMHGRFAVDEADKKFV